MATIDRPVSAEELAEYASRVYSELRLGDERPPVVETRWTPEVSAWFDRYDVAVDRVGEMANWSEPLLRQAAGPVLEVGERPAPLQLLSSAAINARNRAEPMEERARSLAWSALFGAEVDPRGLKRWAKTLVKHTYGNATALERAEEMLPWMSRNRGFIDGAREMIAEAKRLLGEAA